jgi:hypothetical protein
MTGFGPMAKSMRTLIGAALCLSSLVFLPALTPPANAAACAPTVGTVSGTTRYAIFNSGTACTWTVPAGVTNISYLAAGGGGGGGGARQAASSPNLGAGGGGAGGIVLASSFSTSGGSTITLTVGMGGGGGSAGNAGGTGSNTAFTYSSTTITATGGGGGAGSNGANGETTLSGDGGNNTSYTGGANNWDGGGGGAGSAGGGIGGTDIGGQGGWGGTGGAATLSAILGSNAYYGGGGGGGGTPSTNSNEFDGTGGAGGNSVGGTGGGGAGVLPTVGAANTGSGGGGGGWRSSHSDTLRAGASGSDGRIIFTFTKSDSAISSISVSSNAGGDNYYKIGDIISVTVVASEAVTVNGAPRIAVLGLTAKNFSYFSGSGTTSIVFRYTVVTNDTSSAGIGVSANTLTLNGGTMVDSAGFNLPLTHLAVAQSSSHRVDGIVPTLSGMTTDYSVPENETKTITLTPSEPVTYVIAGNEDIAYFVFNSSTGVLSLTPRDFENKLDNGANNGYYIGIAITDAAGNATGSQNFNFTITDVAEVTNVGTPTLSAVATKGIAVTISVTTDVPGKVDFYWNGKRIPGCFNISTTGTAPNITGQCSWKPVTFAPSTVYARIRPTSSSYTAVNSPSITVRPVRRTNLR